jgi:predicted Fe-Mo cluster-binding NifX family protein
MERIVITAEGPDLNAATSERLGRCPFLLFVDLDTGLARAEANPSAGLPDEPGLQAARFIVESGAGAVVTGQVEPSAAKNLRAAGIALYELRGQTVNEVVEHYLADELPPVPCPGSSDR